MTSKLDAGVPLDMAILDIYEKYGIMLKVRRGQVFMINHKDSLGKERLIFKTHEVPNYCTDSKLIEILYSRGEEFQRFKNVLETEKLNALKVIAV